MPVLELEDAAPTIVQMDEAFAELHKQICEKVGHEGVYTPRVLWRHQIVWSSVWIIGGQNHGIHVETTSMGKFKVKTWGGDEIISASAIVRDAATALTFLRLNLPQRIKP